MARLTEQEQQEILRYLEADKPLPEKYRFLLFDDKREVELIWNGKTSEVSNIALPFQTIEQVDEPRSEKSTKLQTSFFDLDERGRQLKGWTNKLIWGDNKLVLSSLKNGPLRDEIEKQGGIKLIYIDPPFDVGADFSMNIEIGNSTFTKKPNILEEIAYRDTWGKGSDSFLAMIFERLQLMKDLLADDGSIFVHCDWRLNSYLRIVMDEVFGKENFKNEIVWKRKTGSSSEIGGNTDRFGNDTDHILFYGKSKKTKFNTQYMENDPEYIRKFFRHKDPDGRLYRIDNLANPSYRPNLIYEYKGYKPPKNGWAISREKMEAWDKEGRLHFPKDKGGRIQRKRYLDELKGQAISNLWNDLGAVASQSDERIGYPTQKPEVLLERIVNASTDEGDLICDFFCGSGTLAAVGERSNRKWIVADIGKFAIHTTRKRLIDVQRERKAEGMTYRAFEILNLGKYERQFYIGLNTSLREQEQIKQRELKEKAFLDLILSAYKAEAVSGFKTFQGKKSGRLIAVGPINLPVSRLFVEEVISECRQKRITQIEILGFEFEMGLFPESLDEAKKKGIEIYPKYIPTDIFDKRAVEKNQVSFHDVAYIEVKPHYKGNSISIELKDFSVFYSQDSISKAEETLKNKGTRIVVDKGQIIKVSKDAKGIVKREKLTNKWHDWVDYWSVDFNFQSKKEFIRVKEDESGEYKEVWTGDYIFENEWQSFKTVKDRELEFKSPYHEIDGTTKKIAIKVVDIFGNDTMTIIDFEPKRKN